MVSSIVKGFYDKGYIEFQEVSIDRRIKRVLLSEAGRVFADIIMQPLWEIEKKALSVLSGDERSEMLIMLERCYKGFQITK